MMKATLTVGIIMALVATTTALTYRDAEKVSSFNCFFNCINSKIQANILAGTGKEYINLMWLCKDMCGLDEKMSKTALKFTQFLF